MKFVEIILILVLFAFVVVIGLLLKNCPEWRVKCPPFNYSAVQFEVNYTKFECPKCECPEVLVCICPFNVTEEKIVYEMKYTTEIAIIKEYVEVPKKIIEEECEVEYFKDWFRIDDIPQGRKTWYPKGCE